MSVQIDPRGPRFSATLTALVLAAVLLTSPSVLGVSLLAFQVVVFLVGATTGIQHTPYAWLFRTSIRPRLRPPTELEDSAPPQFAQGMGLAFGVVGLLGYVTGLTLLGAIATGFALAAAFLNAVFGLCLGCEVYLLIKRATTTKESINGATGQIPVGTKG